MTRILTVSHTHPRLTRGGAEIAAHEQFRRLREAPGVTAFFLAGNGGWHARRSGVVIQRPWGPDEFLADAPGYDHFRHANPNPALAREFAELLAELRPDIVHVHHYLGLGVELFAAVRRHAPQARLVLTLHEYLLPCAHFGQMVTRPDLAPCTEASPQRCHRCFPEHDPRAFFLRELWLKRFLAEVDLFISPSRFLMERHIAWGLPRERFAVLENLLPAAPGAEAPPGPRAGGGPFRAGFFGQLSRLKGVDVLVRAAEVLEEQGVDAVIELHGTAEHQPDSFREHVRKVLAAPPPRLAPRGPYRNEEVTALMRGVDAVLVPSIWWENSPLIIQEAAAAGRPVIGSDLGGIREKLAQMPGSVTFRPGDPLDLVARIAGMAALPAEARTPPPRPAGARLEELLALYAALPPRAAPAAPRRRRAPAGS
ncbi:glycosyltransferase family 4 protein [Roseococcus sp. DSY-14]|uniref:glycosyltransferase family 4 protein n=1 Tax=Roseococcus sp. DSY-14 TaxID=3369650 RepID=UPI00387AD7E4